MDRIRLVLGGVVFGVEGGRIVPPLVVAVASGIGLIAYPLLPGRQGALLPAVVVVSSVGAHMPGRFRHASLLARLWERSAS